MMLGQKDKKVDSKDKKYLSVIVVLMIVAAVGLSIAGAVKEKKRGGEPAAPAPSNEEAGKEEPAASESYLAPARPESSEGDRIIGSRDAALKAFVYEDYDDVWSATMNENLTRLVAAEGDKVAFIVRPFIGRSAKSADGALAVECAGQAGKWQEMRSSLFRALLGSEKMDREVEAGQEAYYFADKAGIDKDAFSACLTNYKKSGKIEQLAAEAEKYGVQGSPTMFVGEEVVLGARPFEDYTDSEGKRIEGLKSVIDRILEAAKK